MQFGWMRCLLGKELDLALTILIANKFLYRFGGTERYVFDMWEALERRGHRVIPFAMAHSRNRETEYSRYFVSNVEYDDAMASRNPFNKARIALRTIYSLEARAKIAALIRDTHPDVAHIHNIYHQISPSILPVLRSRGIPTVQTVHDFNLVCPNYTFFARGQVCEACKSGLPMTALRQRCVKGSIPATALALLEMHLHKVMRTYDRNIQLFITPSSFVREKLVEYGLDATKVVHIRPPMNLTDYTPGFEAGGYALYFGRLAPFKGLATLLKAVKGLKSLPLVIAGEGEIKGELAQTIAWDGLDNVKLLGHVSGESLKETVRGAMFVVVPSEWYENAPFSVLESFAFGKAVIGSRIGGVPELIDENVDGLLFTPGDADELCARMAYLMDHPELCARMGRNGREKLLMRFSPEAHYDRLDSIYRRLKICNQTGDLSSRACVRNR